MPQLVGLECVVCGQRIGSIIDGKFCDGCGNPIHAACRITSPAAESASCPQCGCNPATQIAREVRQERKDPGGDNSQLPQQLKARQKSSGAAFGLIAVGLLNAPLSIFVAYAGLSNSGFLKFGWQEGIVGLFMLVSARLIVFGGVNLVRLRSHGAAKVGAILTLIPFCSPIFLVSLPVGIWSLATLSDPDVKAAMNQAQM
jgi:hypothetical protein